MIGTIFVWVLLGGASLIGVVAIIACFVDMVTAANRDQRLRVPRGKK